MTRKHFLNHKLVLGMCLCFCALLMSVAAQAESIDSLYVEDVNIIKGEIESIKVYSLTRISLESPGVADIISADDEEIVVIGKKEGRTSLFIWDEHGKRILMIHVYEQDLNRVKNRLEELFKSADIETAKLTINEQEGKVVISGDVPEHQKNHFDKLINPFSRLIIDIVTEEDKRDLIQIDAELIDIKESALKKIGLEWTTEGSTYGFNIAFPETLPTVTGMTGGSAMDLFNIGDFNRTTAFSLALHAAISEGSATIVSKPKIVVLNGESADFNVGGEYPITSSTTTDGTITTSTSFKSYGVGMTITPTIIRDKIEIDLSINISDVDGDVSVDSATAFTTTDLSTKLYLRDGQLIVMAGLIKTNKSSSVTRIPYLSKIPVIGKIFSYRSNPVAETDKEILLSLRPTILAGGEKDGDLKKKEGEGNSETKKSSIHVTEEEMVPTDKPTGSHMADYVKDVQQKIARAIAYPEEAKTSGWEGTVKIGLNILKDGTLYYTLLKESSGNEIIDKNALKTVRKVAPYGSFPDKAEEEEISIVIPIAYSIN